MSHPRTPSFFQSLSSNIDQRRTSWKRKKHSRNLNTRASEILDRIKIFAKGSSSSSFSACSSPCSVINSSDNEGYTVTTSPSSTVEIEKNKINKSFSNTLSSDTESFDSIQMKRYASTYSALSSFQNKHVKARTKPLRRDTPHHNIWYSLKEKRHKQKFGAAQQPNAGHLNKINQNSLDRPSANFKTFGKSLSQKFNPNSRLFGYKTREDIIEKSNNINDENVPAEEDAGLSQDTNIPEDAYSCYKMFKSNYDLVKDIKLCVSNLSSDKENNSFGSSGFSSKSSVDNDVKIGQWHQSNVSFDETVGMDIDSDPNLPEANHLFNLKSSFIELPDDFAPSSKSSAFSPADTNETTITNIGNCSEEGNEEQFSVLSGESEDCVAAISDSSAMTQFEAELFPDELSDQRIKSHPKSKVFGLMRTALEKINTINNVTAEEEISNSCDNTMIVDVPVFRDQKDDITCITENLMQGSIKCNEVFDVTYKSLSSSSSYSVPNVNIKDPSFFVTNSQRRAKKEPSIQFSKTAESLIYDNEQPENVFKSIKATKALKSSSLTNLDAIVNSSKMSRENRNHAILKIKENLNAKQEKIRATHCDDVTIEDFITFFETHEKKRMSTEPALSEERQRQIARYYKEQE